MMMNVTHNKSFAFAIIKKISVGVFLYLSASGVHAELPPPESLAKLHTTAGNIKANSDQMSIEKNLYEQMRPIASVSRDDATDQEIDAQVRRYVRIYANRLIENFDYLYQKLTEANAEFSGCSTPQAINPNAEFIASLCVESLSDSYQVKYLRLADDNDWKTLVSFGFEETGDAWTLKSINIPFAPEQKVYVGEI